MKRLNTALLSLLLLMSVLLSACGALPQSGGSSATLDSIPAYSGQAYVELNGNQPTFTEDELVTESFETYSPLDSLGRCGVAYANVGLDTMPTEERGSIGQVKPSGWQTVNTTAWMASISITAVTSSAISSPPRMPIRRTSLPVPGT